MRAPRGRPSARGMSFFRSIAGGLAAALLAACNSGSGSGPEPERVHVSVAPATGQVLTGERLQLTATVLGADDTSVTWAASAGSVDANGLFTAPAELGPVTLTATSAADTRCSAVATLSVVEVPTLALTTEGGAPIVSRDVYLNGTVAIDPRDGLAAPFAPVTMKIKGRGNSTWEMPKKPYKMKLTEGAGPLGMPADREWALLANYADKTLLRNSVAMELSRRLGLPWSPRSRFVELTLNGNYDGTYLLVETVKIAPDRVAIAKLSPSDVAGDALTGGYLVEVDQRRDGLVVYEGLEGTVPIVLKEPDPPAAEQQDYIAGILQAAEQALFSADFADPAAGYAAHWDVDTLVDWYLVEEILKNVDGDFFSSCYVSKDRGGKLRMGPVWDFDLAAGNDDEDACDDPEGWYVRTGPYFARLFQDPAFAARARARWDEVKLTELDTIHEYIDSTAAYLEHAQAANFARWDILDTCVWPNPVCLGNYRLEVGYMKAWLQVRMDWMDQNL